MPRKKHYLLVWPTHRKDWIKVFEDLKEDFDFTFLPSTFPHEQNYADHFYCRYWSEFNSAQELIKEIQPDGIIFMSIESGLSIALNYVAKKEGLKTYILQHGIYTNYRDYRNRERLWRKKQLAKSVRQEQYQRSFSSLLFISRSLKALERWKLIPIALYTQLQQHIGPYWAARHLPLKLKRADHYLCYSPYNATIHKETDRISEDEIIYIGSPDLVPYLQEEEELIEDHFYLHIDQALAENSLGEETLSKKEMIGFYLKLNEFCLSKKAKLYIKLHPESYQSEWLPQHENIQYLRQVENFNRIIQSAQGCFGFYSTMIIPAIYWRPTILFQIFYSGLHENLVNKISIPIESFKVLDPAKWYFSEEPSDIMRSFIREKFIWPKEALTLCAALKLKN